MDCFYSCRIHPLHPAEHAGALGIHLDDRERWANAHQGFLLLGLPVVLFMAGAAAYGIAMLATFICPKPKIGAVIYGTLYILYALSTLINFYGQDNISKVVATIVVVGVAVGSIIGVVAAYGEADS